MRKFTVPILNILLAIGFVCIFAGFFFLVHPFAGVENVTPFINICLIFIGALLFYLSLVKYKRAMLFFSGLYLCLAASLYLLVTSGVLPADLSQLWPCGVILCGICLFFTCLFRHHRVLSSYLFPSSLLVFMGCIFLLFSFDVIDVSFRSFVGQWWPVFLIIVGAFLIGLFLYQQTPDNHFPYEQEADAIDSLGDGDDGE